ncbi:MAG: hypothetical protein LBV12_05600 [Puniceicoccales bacterium]|jgi:hypothetical protein|nr:hypothetical protein [Puniceicoccales bacterium]
MKKYLSLLLLPLLFSACSTGETSPADSETATLTPIKTGLLVDISNPADLKEMESMILPRVNIEGAGPVQVFQKMSEVYNFNAKGQGLKNLPLKMDESAIAKNKKGVVLSIEGENINFRQLYEKICQQAGLVWWVDGALHIEVPK